MLAAGLGLVLFENGRFFTWLLDDLKGGFIIRRLVNNSQYPYAVEQDGDEPRHFDTRWLNSEFGFLKLVAHASRIDRSDIVKDTWWAPD